MKRFISSVLIVLILFSFPFAASAADGSFLIMDGRTCLVLEESDGNQRLPMASTTKIMTAIITIESVGLQEIVEIPKQAEGVEGTSLYIEAGEKYTVEELLYGLMLRSANDCAEALAWYVGRKDRNRFISLMNKKAKALGLKNTNFSNPSGLPEKEHYTTAYELALIMAYAMKNPAFRKITATKQYNIKGQSVQNHNKLLTLYEGCIGGKTGYTIAAGRCLVSVAERKGGRLICVTLGRRDDWNIHTNAYEKWFGELKSFTLEEKGEFSLEMKVAGGGTVLATNCDKVTANLFMVPESIQKKVLADSFLYGNKEIGDVAGTVEYWFNKTKIGESPLVLEQSIEISVKKDLFISRIIRFFRRLLLKKD